MGISRIRSARIVLCLIVVFLAGGCAHKGPKRPPVAGTRYPARISKPYKINGIWYYPLSTAEGYREKGIASWYGADFHGKRTANGEIYNMYAYTAAHKTLPFNTYVKVTNLKNGRSTIVRINDRGPFVRNRIIDLTYKAAKEIGMARAGTAPVLIETVALAYHDSKKKNAGWKIKKPPDPNIGNFCVQVGSFKFAQNAYNLKRRLSRRYPNVRVVTSLVGNSRYYRVRMCRFHKLSDARDALQEIWQSGFVDAFVVAE